jgi:hypothetical protein
MDLLWVWGLSSPVGLTIVLISIGGTSWGRSWGREMAAPDTRDALGLNPLAARVCIVSARPDALRAGNERLMFAADEKVGGSL